MKKVFNFIRFCLLATAVMFGFDACKEPVNNVVVTGVSVSPTEQTVAVGESFTIAATVTPENANNKSVKWASSASDIATVDANGKVEALKAGTATITATTVEGSKTASCKVTVTEQSVDATEVELLIASYYGGLGVGDGYHIYRISFATPGTYDTENDKPKQKGIMYSFVLSSKTPDSQLKPTNGEYSLSQTDDDFTQMTFSRKVQNSFIRNFETTGFTEEPRAITEGKFIVSDNKITFKGKDEKGVEYDIIFEGAYTVVDNSVNPWQLEPQTQTTKTEDFNSAVFVSHNDKYNNGTQAVSVDMFKSEINAVFEFIINKDDSKLKNGTYNVSDSKQAGTILKSDGMIGNVFTATYLAYTSLSEYYFIASGTATVKDNLIDFTGQSHFGSTIKIKYTGDIPSLNPYELEPQTPQTITESFTIADIKDFGDTYKNDTKVFYVVMKSVDGLTMGVLEFFTAKDAEKLTLGSYSVSDSKNIGTLLKSRGRIGYALKGCGLVHLMYGNIYFIVSGQAVVEEGRIQFVGKSYFGSDIIMSYTGDIATNVMPSDKSRYIYKK